MACLTVGRGRLGLLPALVWVRGALGMMARYQNRCGWWWVDWRTRAEEVKDFIENILGEDGLARSVVVAAPCGLAAADASARRGIRDRTGRVFPRPGYCPLLLLMDSVTRYAMAQRRLPWPSASLR